MCLRARALCSRERARSLGSLSRGGHVSAAASSAINKKRRGSLGRPDRPHFPVGPDGGGADSLQRPATHVRPVYGLFCFGVFFGLVGEGGGLEEWPRVAASVSHFKQPFHRLRAEYAHLHREQRREKIQNLQRDKSRGGGESGLAPLRCRLRADAAVLARAEQD